MRLLIIISFLFSSNVILSQGIGNTWLLGNDPGWPNIGRIVFDINSYQLLTEQRKMAFKGTQATISDLQGNFLMSSNGVWIANANNDTMLNGSGLNPNNYTSGYPDGLLIINGNILLPFPDDPNKYVLIHETKTGAFSIDPSRIYKSIIDITLDGGLGAVIQKNDTVLMDTLSWGLAACRHGNGRDWWIIAITDGNPIAYIMLLTPNGIDYVTTQILNFQSNSFGNLSQISFSKDGTKFIYSSSINQTPSGSILLADFDRCSGIFSNEQVISISTTNYIWGLSFSPSGQFVYVCTSGAIFQIDYSTLTLDTVAIYDGFISGFPPNCCATTFHYMYLAANGKIYLTSGSSVQHLHEINYPDSSGISCDVQQHTIALGNYFHLRAVPNHPNYYLGAADGTACDSLGLNSLDENSELEQYFRIYPNPTNGNFSISYVLPQNTNGIFEIFDINGKQVFVENLPPWSNFQFYNISNLSPGIYNCVITAGHNQIYKKLIVLDEW